MVSRLGKQLDASQRFLRGLQNLPQRSMSLWRYACVSTSCKAGSRCVATPLTFRRSWKLPLSMSRRCVIFCGQGTGTARPTGSRRLCCSWGRQRKNGQLFQPKYFEVFSWHLGMSAKCPQLSASVRGQNGMSASTMSAGWYSGILDVRGCPREHSTPGKIKTPVSACPRLVNGFVCVLAPHVRGDALGILWIQDSLHAFL